MDFWSNVQPLMDKKGVRQRDFVRITGKSSASVSDWLNKKIIPRADDALKIADLLGVSVRYLVTGQDEEGISPRERELLQICSILSEEKFKAVKDIAEIMRKETDRELSGGLSSADSEGVGNGR